MFERNHLTLSVTFQKPTLACQLNPFISARLRAACKTLIISSRRNQRTRPLLATAPPPLREGWVLSVPLRLAL